MKPILAVLIFNITHFCSAETLRISELANAAGEGVEQMILKTESGEEALFVKTEAVLTDADVKQAWADPTIGGQIGVELNEEGVKKLKVIMARMQRGRDRLAILVEGRLITAPIIMSTLDSPFLVSGFKNMGFRELDDLARKMSGRPPRPQGEDPDPPKSHPKIESVPFTEEEYQARKALRERSGIFHLESIPSKEDLDKLLRKGMKREEVLKIFGKPFSVSGASHEEHFHLWYLIAPEKRPQDPKRGMLPDGFGVDFTDGKLSRWSHTYSNVPREEKMVGGESPTLRVILPEVDFSSGDLNLVAYVEGIVIPDPKQSVNRRDLGELISIAMSLSSVREKDSAKATLDADCDFMKVLSRHFSEVAALRKSAVEGRVEVNQLSEILSPYVFGKKELPVKAKEGEQAGAGQPAARSQPEGGDTSQPEPGERSR